MKTGVRSQESGVGGWATFGLVTMIILCALCACSFLQPAEIPEGCENSFIINKIPNYREVDVLFQLANVQGIRQDLYTREQALKFLDDCEAMLESTTYSDLAIFVIAKIKWLNEHAGVEVLILSQYVTDAFNEPLPLDACDIDLLKKHIQKQRTLIKMLM